MNLDYMDYRTLNNTALMIASRARVFKLDKTGQYEMLMPSEILEGEMEGGGKALVFTDGRPAINGLAILPRELSKVIYEIGQVYARRR